MSKEKQDKGKAEATSAEALRRQEETLANREIELALRDARVRGRESQLAVQRGLLSERAEWIEARVREMADWTQQQQLMAEQKSTVASVMRGLGDGAAAKEADLDGYVLRSKTLLVARAAMAAERAEMLRRREAQLDDRDGEVGDCEDAMVRAEVRIAARERLVIEAIQKVEQIVGGLGQSDVDHTLRRAKFAQTVTMTHVEAVRQDEAMRTSRKTRKASSAPPVLDLNVPTDPAKGRD